MGRDIVDSNIIECGFEQLQVSDLETMSGAEMIVTWQLSQLVLPSLGPQPRMIVFNKMYAYIIIHYIHATN